MKAYKKTLVDSKIGQLDLLVVAILQFLFVCLFSLFLSIGHYASMHRLFIQAVALCLRFLNVDLNTPFQYSLVLFLYSNRQVYTIENAHGQLVRELDFNPNKQYYLASCGDDCKVKFWDVRNTDAPVMSLTDHSHW